MTNSMKGLVVHLGSKVGNKGVFMRTARQVGRICALQNIPVIYGGSRNGCMGALADGCLENDGTVIGVMPTYVEWQLEDVHSGITELIEVHSMAECKQVMTDLSFGAMVLPGAMETLVGLFEYATSTQLREVMTDADYKIRRYRPLGLLNVDGYYAKLIEFLDESAVADGFMEPIHREIIMHSSNIQKLIDMIAVKT